MMKSIIISFVALLCIVFFGCDKPIIESDGLNGRWEVYQVDSSYIVPAVNDTLWTLIAEIPAMGFLNFNEDQSGSFEDLNRFSCNVSQFTWTINTTKDTIEFAHPAGSFTGFIQYLGSDSLSFRKGPCRGPAGTGYALAYFVKALRVKSDQ